MNKKISVGVSVAITLVAVALQHNKLLISAVLCTYIYFHGLLLTILKLILFYIIAEVLSKSKQMPLLYLFFRKPFTKASFVIRCITERDVSYGCSLETGDF